VANVLGIIGFLVFIAGIVALSAGVTWLVVKFSPVPGAKQKSSSP
jgi:hypothetical protein